VSCEEVPAVNPHWDDHDVFILQVSGEKRWRVYGVTRPYPLYRDVDANTECPKEIVWEGILQPETFFICRAEPGTPQPQWENRHFTWPSVCIPKPVSI